MEKYILTGYSEVKRILKGKISFGHNRLFLGYWKWKSIFFTSHKLHTLYLYVRKKNNRPQNRVKSTNDLPRRQDGSLGQLAHTKVEFCHSISLLCYYIFLCITSHIQQWAYLYIYVIQGTYSCVVLTHTAHLPHEQKHINTYTLNKYRLPV